MPKEQPEDFGEPTRLDSPVPATMVSRVAHKSDGLECNIQPAPELEITRSNALPPLQHQHSLRDVTAVERAVVHERLQQQAAHRIQNGPSYGGHAGGGTAPARTDAPPEEKEWRIMLFSPWSAGTEICLLSFISSPYQFALTHSKINHGRFSLLLLLYGVLWLVALMGYPYGFARNVLPAKIAAIVAHVLLVLVGGIYRDRLRVSYQLRAEDCSCCCGCDEGEYQDCTSCCAHLWCPCSSIAQEADLVDSNPLPNVQQPPAAMV